jgi:hypothetical protein
MKVGLSFSFSVEWLMGIRPALRLTGYPSFSPHDMHTREDQVMGTMTPISPRHANDERDQLMFYRQTVPVAARPETPEPGAVSRFYRFVYPSLPDDARGHGDWLEALIRRNRWLP